MKNKDVQMKKMEDTVHGLDIKLKEKDMKNKSLQDKVWIQTLFRYVKFEIITYHILAD